MAEARTRRLVYEAGGGTFERWTREDPGDAERRRRLAVASTALARRAMHFGREQKDEGQYEQRKKERAVSCRHGAPPLLTWQPVHTLRRISSPTPYQRAF